MWKDHEMQNMICMNFGLKKKDSETDLIVYWMFLFYMLEMGLLSFHPVICWLLQVCFDVTGNWMPIPRIFSIQFVVELI